MRYDDATIIYTLLAWYYLIEVYSLSYLCFFLFQLYILEFNIYFLKQAGTVSGSAQARMDSSKTE